MPFQSQSQRALFHAKAERGEMSQKTVDKWESETPKGKKLPIKVRKPKGAPKALPAKKTAVAVKSGVDALGEWLVKSGGPYIGPRGGKWADPEHKIPWGDDADAVKQIRDAPLSEHASAVHAHPGYDAHSRLQHIPTDKLDEHIAGSAEGRDYMTHGHLLSQRGSRVHGDGVGTPYTSQTRAQMEKLRPAVEHWAQNAKDEHFGFSPIKGGAMSHTLHTALRPGEHGHFTDEELGHFRAMYAGDNSETGKAVQAEFAEQDLKAKSDQERKEQAKRSLTADTLSRLPPKMKAAGTKAVAAGAHLDNVGLGRRTIEHDGKTTTHDLNDEDERAEFHARLKEIGKMKTKTKKSMAGIDGLSAWLAKSGAEGCDLEGLGRQSGKHDSAPGPGADKNGLAGVPKAPDADLPDDPDGAGDDLEGLGKQGGNHSGSAGRGCGADGIAGVPAASESGGKAAGALSPDDWAIATARKSVTAAQTELHGRERAILRRSLEQRASVQLVKSLDDQTAELAKATGFYAGGVEPTLERPIPETARQVLCKSVHQGGCGATYSRMLSECPECGAGGVRHQTMVPGLAPGEHTRLKLPPIPRVRLR
jgi:hypothetical protein